MKHYISEFFGSFILLAIVTGSGFMGETLGAGNDAVALLGNSIATGAGLYVLIVLLGPFSGAHFNPVVSLMSWKLGYLNTRTMYGYWICQFTGALFGVWLTHSMFDLSIIQMSTKAREGAGIFVSELFSTLILLAVIRIGDKNSKDKVPMLVSMTVTAGYWFTSSTFFANPAVVFARSFTNTFVGIAPSDAWWFILAELIAMIIMILFFCKEKN